MSKTLIKSLKRFWTQSFHDRFYSALTFKKAHETMEMVQNDKRNLETVSTTLERLKTLRNGLDKNARIQTVQNVPSRF